MTVIRRTTPLGELVSVRRAMGRLARFSHPKADETKPRQIKNKPTKSGMTPKK